MFQKRFRFLATIYFAELELELLGSIFSAQSWSLKALGVKLEPAPNWSRLSISDTCQYLGVIMVPNSALYGLSYNTEIKSPGDINVPKSIFFFLNAI